MRESNVERYVISIDPCKGITDEAMASMLSSWVNGTVEMQDWIGHDAVRSLMYKHSLRADDVEKMTLRVISALENSGLYTHLLVTNNSIDELICEIKRNIAYIEIHWTKSNEITNRSTAA